MVQAGGQSGRLKQLLDPDSATWDKLIACALFVIRAPQQIMMPTACGAGGGGMNRENDAWCQVCTIAAITAFVPSRGWKPSKGDWPWRRRPLRVGWSESMQALDRPGRALPVGGAGC